MKTERIGLGALIAGRRMQGLALLAMLLSLAGFQKPAQAQNTGTIFGNVVDQSSALVQHATVVAKDADHGITRKTETNSAGEYQILSLPVGTYSLTVSAPTFASEVVEGITIDANANVKEVITLSAGSAAETVTVQDTEGSVIDARSATIGTLLPQKLIDDLPIDGHNIVALAALLPGVVNVNAPSTFTGDTGGPTYSASGGRTTQNLMLFDGLMWNNLFYNTGVNFPTPNAMNQVSILQNNFKAEYGRNAGSVFNALTRSGTNQVHGAFWDYLQNPMFNAADYFSKINPKDNQNQFGITVGGPFHRDKLYFFVAFQQLIGSLQTTGSAPTLTPADRGENADGTPRACSPNGAFPGLTCASYSDQLTTWTNGVAAIGRMVNPIMVGTTTSLSGEGGTTPDNVISSYNYAWQQAGNTGTSPCLALLNQAASFAGSHVYGNENGSSGQPISQTLNYMPYDELPSPCFNPVMQAVIKAKVPYPNASGYATTSMPSPTRDRNLLIRNDWNVDAQRILDVRYNYFVSTATTVPGVNNQSVGVATNAPTHGRAVGNFGR